MRPITKICLLMCFLFTVPLVAFAQSELSADLAFLQQPSFTPTPLPSLVPTWTITPTYPAPQPSPTYPPIDPSGVAPYYPTPTMPPQSPVMNVIELGETVTATLSPSSRYHEYTFQGEAGQVVVLQFTARLSLPSITLNYSGYYGYPYPPSDADGNYTVTLTNVLPYTGDHRVTIDDYYNNGSPDSRDYTLRLYVPASDTINYDETLEATISVDEPVAVYTFSGEQDDLIMLNLASSDFAPSLILAADSPEGGVPELANTAVPEHQTSGTLELPLTKLPRSGEYRIIVRGLNVLQSGEYRLSLSRVVPIPINIGDTVEGLISDETPNLYYEVQGEFGDIVDLYVTTDGSLDTRLNLFNDTLGTLASDDDSGRGLDPEITRLLLSQTGNYIIQVSRYSTVDNGTFMLTLEPSPFTSLNDGPQLVRAPKSGTAYYTFDAQVGETLRLTLAMPEGGSTPSVSITQGAQTILQLPTTTLERLTADFVVLYDQKVVVMLTFSGYGPSVSEIAIERVE